MKKMKVILTVPVLLAILLLPATIALASNPNDVNYCATCGTNSFYWTSGTSVYHTEVHNPPTGLIDSNGNPIYGPSCTVTYVDTPVGKVCSRCHRICWSGTNHQETHSSCGGSKSNYD